MSPNFKIVNDIAAVPVDFTIWTSAPVRPENLVKENQPIEPSYMMITSEPPGASIYLVKSKRRVGSTPRTFEIFDEDLRVDTFGSNVPFELTRSGYIKFVSASEAMNFAGPEPGRTYYDHIKLKKAR